MSIFKMGGHFFKGSVPQFYISVASVQNAITFRKPVLSLHRSPERYRSQQARGLSRSVTVSLESLMPWAYNLELKPGLASGCVHEVNSLNCGQTALFH